MNLYVPMAALAVALASTAGWAQEQPLTRAEVKAELERARADGSLQRFNSNHPNWWEDTRQPAPAAGAAGRSAETGMPGMQGGKTRAEVKEELRQARESGEMDRLRSNYYGGQ